MRSGQGILMGKVVANGLRPVEVLRSTSLQKHESFNPSLHHAWPNPAVWDHQPYLGVTLSADLEWRTLILNIRNNTNSALGFVERNLHRCPQKIKKQAYKSLVRPPLEYGSTVRDPYRAYPKSCLEQVQRRVAHLVPRTYANEKKCVTNALNQLNWPTLEKRRQVAILTLMLPTRPLLIQHQSSIKTRASHPLKFILLEPSCDAYKYRSWRE